MTYLTEEIGRWSNLTPMSETFYRKIFSYNNFFTLSLTKLLRIQWINNSESSLSSTDSQVVSKSNDFQVNFDDIKLHSYNSQTTQKHLDIFKKTTDQFLFLLLFLTFMKLTKSVNSKNQMSLLLSIFINLFQTIIEKWKKEPFIK